MLAEAPMGVRLPPSVAPTSRPKYSSRASQPMRAAMPATTGSMVATYGMLSMNAENRTDAQTISEYIRNRLLPPRFTRSWLMSSMMPL